MGMRVDIHRSSYDSESNAFHGVRTITVVDVEGPFEPTDDAPAAKLARNTLGDLIVVPASDKPAGAIGPMFGGTFAYTSDSRWAQATKQYGAIPVHDRFETAAQYAALSS